MGRMFRIITEGTTEPKVGLPTSTAEHVERRNHTNMNTILNESIPFVEVGGPEGVVTSYTRTVHTMPSPARVVSVPVQAPRVPTTVPVTSEARVLNLPIPEQVRVAPLPMPAPIETLRYVQTPLFTEVRETAAPQRDTHKLSVALHKFPKPGLRILPSEIAPEIVAYHHPEHPVSAEYRLLREEIRRHAEQSEQRIVSFTSVGHASGTTTVLLNIAVAMTHDRTTRVLVVDANFGRPSISARLGVGDAPGVAEVLAQSVPLAWAVQTTSIPGLHVLAAGAVSDKTYAHTAHELPRLVSQVKQWFDVVLVDGGLWDSLTGVRHLQQHTTHHSLATVSDAVYLVTRQTDLERIEFNSLRNAIGTNLKGYITTRS